MYSTDYQFDEEQILANEIADIYVDEFDAPVEVLTYGLADDNTVYGALISGGNFYSYAFDGDEIGYNYEEDTTQELNDYAAGLMAGYGIKNDSDAPIDYARGFFRVDAQVQCKKGGKPCGKICLPKGAECRKHGGGRLNTAGGNRLKSGGAKVALGVLAGAAGVGAAGAAAGAAYANRDKIREGVDRGKRAVAAGRRELREGKQLAQEALKKGMNFANEIDKEGIKQENTFRAAGNDKEKRRTRLARTTGANIVRGGAVGGAAGAIGGSVVNAASAARDELMGKKPPKTKKEKAQEAVSKVKDIVKRKTNPGTMTKTEVVNAELVDDTPKGRFANPRKKLSAAKNRLVSVAQKALPGSKPKALPSSESVQKALPAGKSSVQKALPAGKSKDVGETAAEKSMKESLANSNSSTGTKALPPGKKRGKGRPKTKFNVNPTGKGFAK